MPAAELFIDDSRTVQEIFRKHPRKNNDRKTRQLCRQVERAVSLALGGQCADPLLQALAVQSVEPAPDASRLMISVYLPAANTTPDPCAIPPRDASVEQGSRETIAAQAARMSEILARLENVRPLLRREVAAAITRKRAPELVFGLTAQGEVTP